MNIPYQSCQFSTYEAVKTLLIERRGGTDETPIYSPIDNTIAGGAAGGVAAAVTAPLDLVKTRLQTQGDAGVRYTGALDAVRRIHLEEGLGAFSRGVVPRVLFHIPSMAICWTTYETCKHLLA